MTEYDLDDRWKENREALQLSSLQIFSAWLIVISIFVVVLGYLIRFNGLWSHFDTVVNMFNDFYANVSSELISIVITVLILDRLNQKNQSKEELKRLTTLLGSSNSLVTQIAIAELKARGWLYDGSLINASLFEANLEKARLSKANLSGCTLTIANLNRIDLIEANLSKAWLDSANINHSQLLKADMQEVQMSNAKMQGTDARGVNLKHGHLFQAKLAGSVFNGANLAYTDFTESQMLGCQLMGVNLEGSRLIRVDLRAADLTRSDLMFANLHHADLTGTRLREVNLEHAYLEGVTLPDGTKFVDGINLDKFTDPSHSDYVSTMQTVDRIASDLVRQWNEQQ